MKKFTLLAVMALAISISSCKKDRICECTYTRTDPNGDVSSDPNYNTTFKDIKKSDARSLCQKSTSVDIDNNGGTTTEVYDCKLK